MRIPRRAATFIVGGGMLIAGAGYSLAQTSAPECRSDELWLDGKPGRQVTVSGFGIPPEARMDDGVTFCLRGVVVKASEATMIERNGERTFTLRGTVTLTMPSR